MTKATKSNAPNAAPHGRRIRVALVDDASAIASRLDGQASDLAECLEAFQRAFDAADDLANAFDELLVTGRGLDDARTRALVRRVMERQAGVENALTRARRVTRRTFKRWPRRWGLQ